MKLRACLFVLGAVLLAGCGGHRAPAPAPQRNVPSFKAGDIAIGVVGPYTADIPGAWVEHGTLAAVADDPLVLVQAGTPAAAHVAEAAAEHPSTYFAVVGASEAALHLPNVAGLVLRDDQAAELAGVVAGLVAAGEGVEHPRVGWAGPEQDALAAAFAHGAHAVDGRVEVLHSASPNVPAACKEAALELIQRDAVAIAAPTGECAAAAVEGAHEQNVVGLRLSDFELPNAVAAAAIRDAVAGIYHGGEDVVFGRASGAIGVAHLDPRIDAAIAIRARTLAGEAPS